MKCVFCERREPEQARGGLVVAGAGRRGPDCCTRAQGVECMMQAGQRGLRRQGMGAQCVDMVALTMRTLRKHGGRYEAHDSNT